MHADMYGARKKTLKANKQLLSLYKHYEYFFQNSYLTLFFNFHDIVG